MPKSSSSFCIIFMGIGVLLLAFLSFIITLNNHKDEVLASFSSSSAFLKNRLQAQDENLATAAPIITTTPSSLGEIIKGKNDLREYKVITLSNSMEVVLVSDKTGNKAAAAINVGVGHYADPEDTPGMAHFVEHAVFMGSAKYPDSGHFLSNYIATKGGVDNAYTDMTDTSFYFECDSSGFETSLDIFSHLFIDPLLDVNSLSREINAIDAENGKNLNNDNWRIEQLLRSTSNPQHPYHKFGTGSLETLNSVPDIASRLKEWYESHYSADLMKAVLIGPQDMEELERIALEYLQPIPKRETKNIDTTVEIRGTGRVGVKYELNSITSSNTVIVNWAIANNGDINDKSLEYISSIIESYRSNGLYYYLSLKNWANSLTCEVNRLDANWIIYSIHVDLTEEGFDNVDSVITNIYQRIAQIKPSESEWAERKVVAESSFNSLEISSPMKYSKTIAKNMRKGVGRSDYLYSSYKWGDFDANLIQNYLDILMSYGDMYVVVASPKIPSYLFDKVEKWYNFPYRVLPFSEIQLAEWTYPHESNLMFLSTKKANIYIPYDDVSKQFSPSLPTKVIYPSLILDDTNNRVWFKKDENFGVPKVRVFMRMLSNEIDSSPSNQFLSLMFIRLVSEQFKELGAEANEGGITYSVTLASSAIEMDIYASVSQIQSFTYSLLRQISSLSTSQDIYNRVLSRTIATMSDYPKSTPLYSQVLDTSRTVLQQREYSIADILASISPSITLNDIYNHANIILSFLEVEMLVMGMIDQSIVLDINKKALLIIGCSPPPQSHLPPRARELDHLQRVIIKNDNQQDDNTAVAVIYQIGMVNDDLLAHALLLNPLFKEAAYQVLRTEKQLGYVVTVDVMKNLNMLAIIIRVQGINFSSEKVQSEIEAFVTNFVKELQSMEDGVVSHITSTHSSTLATPYHGILDESSHYLQSIRTRQYDFDVSKLIDAFKPITKQSLIQFYEKYFLSNESLKLVVVAGGGEDDDTDYTDYTNYKEIDNLTHTLVLAPIWSDKVKDFKVVVE